MSKTNIAGLYAIADTSVVDEAQLIERSRAVLQGGASVIQYRDKKNSPQSRLHQAKTLRVLTREYQAVLIINDDYQLAVDVGADGVHLGEEDGALSHARDYFRANNHNQAIIGISCYNQLELAETAQQQGADYVAFGRCFSSTTKPGDRYVSRDQLIAARQRLTVPIVVIGGITIANAADLLSAGVDAVAVIAALYRAEDSRQAAQSFCQLMA